MVASIARSDLLLTSFVLLMASTLKTIVVIKINELDRDCIRHCVFRNDGQTRFVATPLFGRKIQTFFFFGKMPFTAIVNKMGVSVAPEIGRLCFSFYLTTFY